LAQSLAIDNGQDPIGPGKEIMDLCNIEPRRTAADEIDEMIRASGAKSTDRLIIMDARNIDLLLGLCRRGFKSVSCFVADRKVPGGEAAADVVWIPEVESEAQLLALVACLGRSLRADGALLIIQQCWFAANRLRYLPSLLIDQGFQFEKQMITAGGSRLF
jgi:hypothetical protein